MNTILPDGKSFTTLQKATGKKLVRSLLLLAASALVINANAQADKRLVLAEKYFSAGDYYTAAGLYGQFLKPEAKTKSPSNFPLNANRNTDGMTGKYGSKNDIVYKQAESYRLANYWQQAADVYKQSFEIDPSKYASALYWYAVCQRGLGYYTEAENSINTFLKTAEGNPLKQDAEKELQTIRFIKQQLSRPDTVLYRIQKITPPTGVKGFFAPTVGDGQMLITSTMNGSVAEGINPYRNRLFSMSYDTRKLGELRSIDIEGLDSTMSQGTASMSTDGKYLYFTQWKNANGQSVSSIYYSAKTATGWGRPVLLSTVNQSGFSSRQPFCSSDGKLYFSSNRDGGVGGFDIWYAPIKEDGSTGEAMNVGKEINTEGNEQSPFYHNGSNTLVFASDRIPGMGGFDLFSSKKMETGWKTPENMGYPVNSSRDDIYFFSTGEKNLLDRAYFSSDRGSDCCLSTYSVVKAGKKKVLTGSVRSCEDNVPLADVAVSMKDATGNVLQTRTDAQGRYSFAISSDDQKEFTLTLDGYNEKSAFSLVESIDESAWHTDILHNTEMCIEKKRLIIKAENVVSVYFEFDKHILKERAIAQLDSIYNVLMEDSTTTIQISGYTDGKGSVAYNAKLSDKRARACANYLIQRGIDSRRITFESFGSCCPVEMELIDGRDNPDGRSLNRRALINVNKVNGE
jgi:OOP family OmpA-OmpF porin